MTTNGIGNALALYNTTASLANTNVLDDGPLSLGGGTLTISNNLNLAASSLVNFLLATNDARINVISNLALSGTLNVSAGPGFTGGSYTLFSYGRNLTWGPPILGGSPPGYNFAFNTNTAGQIKLTAQVSNTPPLLAPIADRVLNAGMMLIYTNVATDTDQPPQTLTFSLLAAPTNASLVATNGLFSWRPLVSQANSINLFKIKVADNGSPILSATQSFLATVNPLTNPALTSLGYGSGQFSLSVSGGTIGPDYVLETSSNLANWLSVLTTNSPALPFRFVDTNASAFPLRFYRARLAP